MYVCLMPVELPLSLGPFDMHLPRSRYIYVPLGGSGESGWVRMRNVFCVFTFVALWHDMTLQLLLWGWLSAVAFAPEAFVQWVGGLPRVAAFAAGRCFPLFH